MAERETPLPAMHDAFDRARGEDMDGVWAYGVSWLLLKRDVESAQIRDGLAEALAVVEQTGESPEELFGPPREHADALYDRWVTDGQLVLAARVTSWRDVIGLGLAMSGFFAVLSFAYLVVRGELSSETVVQFVVIALVIGVLSSVGHALWERRHQPRGLSSDTPADLRWSVELTEVLRTRFAMSGRRVRQIVAEANAHAAEAGRPVAEEFGTPTSYAARFAPDLRRRSRLTAVFFAILAGSAALSLVDEPSWPSAALATGLGWLAWREHRSSRRMQDSTAH